MGAVDENSSAWASYIAQRCRISEALNCLFLLVHHRPTRSDSEELRGHSSHKAAADAVFQVEGEADERRVTGQKVKDSEVAALLGGCARLNRDGQLAAGASMVAYDCVAVRDGVRNCEASAVRQEAATWGARGWGQLFGDLSRETARASRKHCQPGLSDLLTIWAAGPC